MKSLAMVAGWFVCSMVAFGESLNPKQVPAEAKWVVHADLDQLRGSEMGKFAMAELDRDEHKRKLDAFQAIFNMDPRKDVSSVTVYGKGHKEEENVALFKGKFDAQRLVTLIKANESYQELGYNGQAIHSWQEKKGGREVRTHAAILADGTVALGGKAALEEALDVADGKRESMQSAGTLSELSVAAKRACFMVAGASFADMRITDPSAAFLKEAAAGQLFLSEASGQVAVEAVLVSASDETAEQLEAVARGFIALGILQREKNPALADMARRTRIGRDGKRVTAVFTCPASDVVKLVREHLAKKNKGSANAGTAE